MRQNREITLTNNSVNGQNYIWKFGDGNTSLQFEPQYTYTDTGWFKICLDASNYCDVSTFCDSVHISPYVGVRSYMDDLLKIYPNPSTGKVYLDFGKIQETIQVKLFNYQGENLDSWIIRNSSKIETTISGPTGLYYFEVIIRDVRHFFKVIKE